MSLPPVPAPSATRDGAPAAQCLAKVDDRGRLHLPLNFTGSVTWLKQQDGTVSALAILEAPGLLRLLSWEQEGKRVQGRRAELLERIAIDTRDTEALETLMLIEDRYKTLSIPKELRPTLPKEALLHLGILGAIPCHVYLERYGDALEVLSPSYRNERLRTHATRLVDLP
jgi:hypothetical protein